MNKISLLISLSLILCTLQLSDASFERTNRYFFNIEIMAVDWGGELIQELDWMIHYVEIYS